MRTMTIMRATITDSINEKWHNALDSRRASRACLHPENIVLSKLGIADNSFPLLRGKLYVK